jgi:SAM-dependent methyltransferase
MATDTGTRVDWQSWLDRWDAQQGGYIPDREARFAIMLDAVESLLPAEFVALDLACGPGAISRRLLDRFPAARAVAVDLDPFLIALGRGALGDVGGRLRWAEANLHDPEWPEVTGEQQFDAVLSTTALHWLAPEHLAQVYATLGRLVRPGGLFLNGDNMAFPPELPSFTRLAQWEKERLWTPEAFAARGVEEWEAWWAAARAEPAFAELLAERTRRFEWHKGKDKPWTAPGYETHVALLKDAGFREVGTIWQFSTNRVLMAVR